MARPFIAKSWRRSALLCFLLTSMTQAAGAQGIAGSFEQLKVLVRPGETVTVTETTGQETTGKIADLSSSTLALLAGGTRRELSESDVRTIQQRHNDSLANGALYGLAIGAVASAALIIAVSAVDSEEVDAGLAALAIGAYGGIGAGIGVGVDALIRKRHVIYQRQSLPGVQVGIAPWLTSQRKGVLVTLRF
jgi:hypothetical protein